MVVVVLLGVSLNLLLNNIASKNIFSAKGAKLLFKNMIVYIAYYVTLDGLIINRKYLK